MATILPVQRNAITPVPPLPLENEWGMMAKWFPQLLNVTYKTRVDTQVLAVASGVSTPFLIIPKSRGLWLVTAGVGPVNDAVNYQAAGIVAMDGTSSRLVVVWNAPNQSLTLAGQTLSSTQASGGPQTLTGTAIQLTHFGT